MYQITMEKKPKHTQKKNNTQNTLGRILVAVQPRWSMRDQFHSGSSDSASEEA